MKLEGRYLHIFCLLLVFSAAAAESYGEPPHEDDDVIDVEDAGNIVDDGYDDEGDDGYDLGIKPGDENRKSLDEIIEEASSKAHKDTSGTSDPKKKMVKVEFDMDFTEEELEQRNITSSKDKRTAALVIGARGAARWTGNKVRYQLAPKTFTTYQKNQITAGMKEWAKYTCLTFSPVTSGNRVYIRNGDGCSSRLGMVGGRQYLNLAEGCREKSVVVHELGHAIGLQHEQTRPDRDNYVTILKDNIENGKEGNFARSSWKIVKNLGIYYDYISIMHYGAKAFSKNTKLTIKTKHAQYQNIIGRRRRLSFRDIKTVNVMHQCAKAKRCKLTDSDCPGEGFVGPDCKCWCPGDPYTLCKMTTANTCQDLNSNCPGWAQINYCNSATYKAFMGTNCRKSCRLCSADSCRDYDSNCAGWVQKKYCTSSTYKAFMASKCKKSCGLCGTGTTSQKTCSDANKYCSDWAKNGECQKNPKYMLASCKKSCNVRNC